MRREKTHNAELLQQFRDAAGLFADKPALVRHVDITKPIPVLRTRPTVLDQISDMTSVCRIQASYKPDMDPQFNIEFYNNGSYFGAISALLKIVDGKIQLYEMSFDRDAPGFSPYAVRYMVEVLRDVKDLVISTGAMHEFNKLYPLKKMGLEILENATGKPFTFIHPSQGMEPCRAVIPFADGAAMENLFSNFGLPVYSPSGTIKLKPPRSRLVERLRSKLPSRRL